MGAPSCVSKLQTSGDPAPPLLDLGALDDPQPPCAPVAARMATAAAAPVMVFFMLPPAELRPARHRVQALEADSDAGRGLGLGRVSPDGHGLLGGDGEVVGQPGVIGVRVEADDDELGQDAGTGLGGAHGAFDPVVADDVTGHQVDRLCADSAPGVRRGLRFAHFAPSLLVYYSCVITGVPSR